MRFDLFQKVRPIWLAASMIFLAVSPHARWSEGAVLSRVLRVAPTGSDVEDCGSAELPCRTIQYAVNRAASGDTILVAAGTYTYTYDPKTDQCRFLITQAVVCFVNKHLTILGGYSPDNWLHPDPERNLTVIDGENRYRGVVVVSHGSMAGLRMEGFTIRNGRAQGASSGSDWDTTAFGGGMWAQNSAVTLRDVVFENNVARGGDTSSGAGGTASGGGLAIQSPPPGSVSVLERVVFRNNRAIGGTGAVRGGLALGGGMFTYQAVVSGTVLTFVDNIAQAGSSDGNGTFNGLDADALGGGAAFQHGSVIMLSNVRAIGNQAVGGSAGARNGTRGGGGFGGAFHSEEAVVDLSEGWIQGNRVQGGSGGERGGVGFGGGLEFLNSNVTLKRVWVIGNVAISGEASILNGYAGSPGGGGAYLWGFRTPSYSGELINVVFADNQIVMPSSGRSDLGGGGGGLVVQGMVVTITHGTFAQNRFAGNLVSGQAILVHGTEGSRGIPGVANIRYSIIADHVHPYTDHTSALTVSEGSQAHLYRCLFSGNTNNTNLNGRPLPPGVITGMDTVITATSVGFTSPGAPDYDYHVLPTSPAVDKAIGSTTNDDIDAQSRPYGHASDIGADEYVPPMLSVTPEEVIILVSGDVRTTRSVIVGVKNTARTVSWEATTSAPWLFLGPSGSAKTASGQSGEWLQLWFDPSGLSLGMYQTSVQITSPDAISVTLPVRMWKLERVFTSFLPLILRR